MINILLKDIVGKGKLVLTYSFVPVLSSA